MSCFITAYGLISALGEGVDASAEALLAWQAKGSTPLTRYNQALLDGRLTPVGRVEGELPAIPAALAPYASRNNQLLLAALAQIRPALGEALATFGPARVGLVLGTSTAGIGEAELAVAAARRGEAVPPVFDYRQQELGSPSEFLARHLGLEGPLTPSPPPAPPAPVPSSAGSGCWRPDWWMRCWSGAPTACAG